MRRFSPSYGPLSMALLMVVARSAFGDSEQTPEFVETKEPPANTTTPYEEGAGSAAVEETFVLGDRRGNFTEITQETQKLVDMPGALGDPLAAIFSLPGVVYADGAFGEPAVRGSSPEDNLFNVDFLPAGYIFHQFNTSVFHESIIQDFQLYSAGFGPEYSNVTGAVFDIRLREPKKEPWHAVIDLSMLRSGIFVEGQVTENSAMYLSGRQSLIHLFIETGGDGEDGVIIQDAPRDNDYQFKYVWDVSSNNKVSISAGGAADTAAANLTQESDFVRSNPDFAGDVELDNSFDGQNIIWDSYGKGVRHFKLGIGSLRSNNVFNFGQDYFQEEDITDTTVRAQYTFPLGRSNVFTFGGFMQQTENVYRLDLVQFVCTEFDVDCTLTRRDRIATEVEFSNTETMVYANNTWQPSEVFSLDLGLQYQHNDYTDETVVNPRIALRYNIGENWSVTSSGGRYNRFPDIETVAPVLGNPELASPTANHFTLGLENQLSNGWSWNIEAYYKTMDNLPLALQEGDPDADLLYINSVQGTAAGVDLLINKELTSKWYSWLAISYSKSTRRNQRTDQTVDYFLDTPLIFNWVFNYSPSSQFNFGARWTVRSGAAYTPIVGVQDNPFFEDGVLPLYGEAFSDRLPLFSQLDVRFKWYKTLFRRDVEYYIDILNVLNQENVTGRGLDYDRVDSVDDEVRIEETQGLGIIPALGMRLKF